MNDIIEFPNNSENYYRKALNELNAHRFDQAETLLLKSLTIDFHTDAFFELIHLYIALHRQKDLSNLWETYYPETQSRLENEHLAYYYAISVVAIQPLTKALIELYRLRDYFKQREWNISSIQLEINRLNQHQLLEEELAQAIANNRVAAFLDELYATGPYNLLAHLKYLYTLPYERCAPLYPLILQHLHIEQYIKSDILHYLLNQNINKTLSLTWFGETYTISTDNLRPYNAQSQFLATVRAVQAYCEQHNPHLYDELIQQLTLQAMCFYPFINEVLHEPNAWVAYMTGEEVTDSPLANKIAQASNELFHLFEQESPN